MFKQLFLSLVLSATAATTHAQNTFKAGWNNYTTGMIIHEYTYNYTYTDSLHLYLADSTQIFVTPDSLVTMCVNTPLREKTVYKTANYLNAKKRVMKSEEYRGDELLVVNEWKYDDKNRKIYHQEDNRSTNTRYKKNYDYANDKKTGELVMTESSYYNGKIEFYTKSYFDKNMVKYKEVRLNDNNKDVIHIENYTYGDNGKLKERSVFFPEFKVTKKFAEKGGDAAPKCFKSLPAGIADKPGIATKVAYIKRIAAKNQAVIQDPDCHDFEFKFINSNSCEVVFNSTKVNNVKQVTFRFKEKY